MSLGACLLDVADAWPLGGSSRSSPLSPSQAQNSTHLTSCFPPCCERKERLHIRLWPPSNGTREHDALAIGMPRMPGRGGLGRHIFVDTHCAMISNRTPH